MFGFVSSQISMKLHQYLDGFDILLLTTPLLIQFFVCNKYHPYSNENQTIAHL